MRSGVLVIAALAGCGDNVVPPTAEPASGTRLKLQQLAYDDGTEQLAAGMYFDAERAETCRPLGWSDGFTYCTPPALPTAYTDVDCTVDVGVVPAGAAVPSYFIHEFVLAGRALPSRLYAAGEPLAPAALFTVRALDGACIAFDASGAALHALGAEVSRDALVAIDRDELATTDRLGVVVEQSADGMRAPVAVVDREHRFQCAALPPNVASPACAPVDPAPAVFFHDAACTEPELAFPRDPPPRAVVAHPDGCATFHDVAGEVGPVPLFRRTQDRCIEGTVSGERTFLLDAPLALASVGRTRGAGARLRPSLLAELGIADHVMFDSELGTDCEPTGAPIRCLPPAASAIPLFRDALCLEEITVALVPTSPCATPVHYARRGDDFHRIEAPSAGVFEITTGDRCVPYIPVAGLAVHDVGPALALDAFAGATLRVRD